MRGRMDSRYIQTYLDYRVAISLQTFPSSDQSFEFR